MADVTIENPILNSPFAEPTRHFRFADEGITERDRRGRARVSSYFVPIAQARRRRAAQLVVRHRVDAGPDRGEQARSTRSASGSPIWRQGRLRRASRRPPRGCSHYWTDPDREKQLFFCQIEALETAIYLTEVAPQVRRRLDRERAPRGERRRQPRALPRIAFKMATGSRQDRRHGDAHRLAGAQQARQPAGRPLLRRLPRSSRPGITIRDRLRVLLPNDPGNYYRERDIVPPDQLETARPGQDRHHQLPRLPAAREGRRRGKLTKEILGQRRGHEPVHRDARPDGAPGLPRARAPRRTSSSSTTRRTTATAASPTAEDGEAHRRRARARPRSARRRPASGSPASRRCRRKIGVKAIYDLSATPFFLRGSGYPEGTLFPWVVSDFSLIDAIEAGIVKVPRVPVADDSMTGEQPTYRDLWLRIREDLPKKGRKTDAVERRAEAPGGARRARCTASTATTRSTTACGRQNAEARARGAHAAGLHRRLQQHQCLQARLRLHRRLGEARCRTADRRPVPGKLPLFSNDDGTAAGRDRPNTILVDSQQLESGEAMSADFKKIAAAEIEEFKAEYRAALPRPRRRGPHRRRPAPRGDEHRRQARQARRARQVRRVASPCSPRAGTPTPSPTSSACAPSARSSSASRWSAAACGA